MEVCYHERARLTSYRGGKNPQGQFVCHNSCIYSAYVDFLASWRSFSLPGGLCRWGPGHGGLGTCWQHLPQRWKTPHGRSPPNLVHPYLGLTTTGHTAGLERQTDTAELEIKNTSRGGVGGQTSVWGCWVRGLNMQQTSLRQHRRSTDVISVHSEREGVLSFQRQSQKKWKH